MTERRLAVGCVTGLLFAGVLSAAPGRGGSAPLPKRIEYNRHIRPLLAGNCLKCHGHDANVRKARLRLDKRAIATGKAKSGARAIVPGNASASEMIKRITHADEDERMPPPEANRTLTARQIALLRRWIEQGAEYQPHFSFVKPVRRPYPAVKRADWPRNGIDRFVLARLEANGLAPAPEADKYTLLRRVTLDLTGLPPAPEDVEAFIRDKSPKAYEAAVDRLLASKAYGERWAHWWLDMARYADTQGYEKDNRRTIWRYRDWVIQAFNRDLPFDRFTTEQLAGDLLPNPTTDQLLATAFHRNTMTNTEGGTDDEEFRTDAVLDRVSTTFQVWMALTAGCAVCHNHKYDPISQEEFYSFYAFFNQTEDADRANETPTLRTPVVDQQERIEKINGQIAALEKDLLKPAPAVDRAQAKWEAEQAAQRGKSTPPALGPWHFIGPFRAKNFDQAHAKAFGPETAAAVDLKKAYGKRRWRRQKWKDGKVIAFQPSNNSAYYLYRKIDAAAATPLPVSLGSDDGIRVFLNGSRVLDVKIGRGVAPDQNQAVLDLRRGANHLVLKISNGGGATGFYFKAKDAGLPPAVVAALKIPAAKRTGAQKTELARYYRMRSPALKVVRDHIRRLKGQIATLNKKAPTTPIMRELPAGRRRKTHILVKGNFLVKGAEVSAKTPAFFPPLPKGAPRNRLGVAQWLTARDNPLTARVLANRYWEQLFGIGIVETSEDFGRQGELPTHPNLLDWLALEVMDRGWSLKALCRLIVTSAAYRQSARGTARKRARDPHNRLLSRGPRVRLDAEQIRDQALAVSGLLSRKMYGPSVMPPQPPGIWMVVYSGDKWATSKGEDRYRRGLYTFWRRTSPHPAMTIFDAPSREVCTVRRIRTNTPLQALVTLNDPAYVEAAQALARRIAKEAGADPEARIRRAILLCLARPARAAEVRHLKALFDSEYAHYKKDRAAALKMATVPLGAAPKGADTAALAAWTVVCNVILNLDEMLTKG